MTTIVMNISAIAITTFLAISQLRGVAVLAALQPDTDATMLDATIKKEKNSE